MREEQLTQLQALAAKWRAEAVEGIPEYYRDRGMSGKYPHGDNYEGGLCACADEIEEILLSEKVL